MRLSAIPPTIHRLNVRPPGRRAFRRRTITRKRDGRWRVRRAPTARSSSLRSLLSGSSWAWVSFRLDDRWYQSGRLPPGHCRPWTPLSVRLSCIRRMGTSAPSRSRLHPCGACGPLDARNRPACASLYSLDRWVVSLPIPDTSKWLFIEGELVLFDERRGLGNSARAIESEGAPPQGGRGSNCREVRRTSVHRNRRRLRPCDTDHRDFREERPGSAGCRSRAYRSGNCRSQWSVRRSGRFVLGRGGAVQCDSRATTRLPSVVDAYPMLLSGASSSLQPVEFRACSGDVSYDVAYQIVGGHDGRSIRLLAVTLGWSPSRLATTT